MGNACKLSISCDAMATRCWDDCIRGRAMYICKLEENMAALEIAFQELKDIRNDVAQQQQLLLLNQVQGWLSRVAAVENEVDKLISDGAQEIERLCLGGCCSKNYKSSYKFGKRVAQKLESVLALKSGSKDFIEVDKMVSVSLQDKRPTDPVIGFESTFDKVWICVNDEQVGIVGLYGIGGVGKTTLLLQINNKLVSPLNVFDVIIWVLVSKDMKVEKIQEDIGEKIGFSNEWKSKSLDAKAIDILRVLSQKKFALLLDDIWERIDLTKVGIPHPDIQNGSKVVFTTRSEKVCHLMEAQKKIRVECLAWEKAWELFRKKVGEEALSNDPAIPKLAETVAKECCGLPLALITTGRAMTGKRKPQQWRRAIEVLRRNASEFQGKEEEVFPILKFSYDYLRNDKVRSCFLYCALFPEDFSIDKKDLIDYWIGEVFLHKYDDRSKAEDEGDEIIDTLVQASLLEEVGDSVKMHDVIRDLALWITSECGKVKDNYLVKAGAQLNEAPEVEKWERATRVSLMTNDIENLTKTPKCPKLVTLFLHENQLKMIASEFFQFMPFLKVLDLSRNKNLKELPLGISKLASLEHLNISKTAIQELPDELKTLIRLKYLNLEYAWKLNRIPPQFISSFSKLEVLRMFYCGYSRNPVEESDFSRGNNELLVEKLLCLKHLNTLTIDIKGDYAFQRFLSFQKLLRCTQTLFLCFLSNSEQLNVSCLANMKRLEEFWIMECESLQELKIEWASEGREIQVPNDLHNSLILSERCFDNLRIVWVGDCLKLGDLTWLILAPSLTFLHVWNCSKIEEIINVEKLGEVSEVVGYLNPFSKLEELRLYNLPELKSIYRGALPFPHLRTITVSSCPKLKKLPLNSAKESRIIIRGLEPWWKELEWEDEATQMAFLPCFNDITSS